jgi:kynurenine formamidase
MTLQTQTQPSVEQYQAYKGTFSNWGRWGDDDQMGTLNHITDQARRDATALVRNGRTVSLANPIATEAVISGPRNPRPADHEMALNPSASLDYIGVSYHGFVNTHIDALCHIYTGENGQLYNGRDSSLVTENGALTNSVDYWRDGIVTRGVLYDIPVMRGTDHVTLDDPVEGWHLQEWAERQLIEPRPGDAVLIRSGAEPFYRLNPDHEFGGVPSKNPGVGVSAIEFLHDTEAALLGWDLQEASGQEQYGRIPIHEVVIPYMGMPLLDNANFERLSEMCAEHGRYEFLLVIAPLVVIGGTGSPVNPIATF